MKARFVLALLFSAVAGGQPLVEAPKLGCIVTPEGSVREVLGLNAAVIAGEPAMSGVRRAVCGSRISVVLLKSGIVAVDSRGKEAAWLEANEPDALLSIAPGGESAAAYLASTGRWYGLRENRWEELPLRLEEEVVAIAAGSGGAIAAVARREERLWLVLLDSVTGMRVKEEPVGLATEHAFVWPDGAVLLAGEGGAVFRLRDGSQSTVHFPRVVTGLAAMSELGVLVTFGERDNQYALLREGDRISVFAIPGGAE